MRLTEQTRVIEVKRSLVGIVVSRRRTYEQERVSLSAPLKNPPFMGDFLMAFARGLELTKEGSLTRRSRRDGSIAALATTKRPSILYARSVSLTALKGCSYITHDPFGCFFCFKLC